MLLQIDFSLNAERERERAARRGVPITRYLVNCQVFYHKGQTLPACLPENNCRVLT